MLALLLVLFYVVGLHSFITRNSLILFLNFTLTGNVWLSKVHFGNKRGNFIIILVAIKSVYHFRFPQELRYYTLELILFKSCTWCRLSWQSKDKFSRLKVFGAGEAATSCELDSQLYLAQVCCKDATPPPITETKV